MMIITGNRNPGLQVPVEADLSATGRKDTDMKNWYLADYKDENGNYHTALALCDREEQAEEHFKKYDMASVRIAAEDEICHYRSKGCPVVEL